MKIAVEGCCHGELGAIYEQIRSLEHQNGYRVDALLICGDFQAIRNHQDLQCMAVPQKYKRLGEFHKYYTGELTAPVLTLVIGGNHEASNYLWELYHGGWLAPNIYFLGHAGAVRLNGVRIAGASGIFKHQDFRQGHYESVPYNSSSIRSIYHIREYNVRRLSLLPGARIFLSHDWPQGIEHHGDLRGLLRRKPFFRQDVQSGSLGSPPLMGLLATLQPEWWFAAHLHVRFEATVVHSEGAPEQHAEPSAPEVAAANPDEILIDDDDDDDEVQSGSKAAPQQTRTPDPPTTTTAAPFHHANPDEVLLDDEEEDVAAPPAPAPAPPPQHAARTETKFLALDKCLPNRHFLEVIDVPSPSPTPTSPPTLAFDPDWLAITKAFAPYLSRGRRQAAFPDEAHARAAVAEARDWVVRNVPGKLAVAAEGGPWRVADCQVFARVAPGPGAGDGGGGVEAEAGRAPPVYPNPQTDAFCSMLEIENKITPPMTMQATTTQADRSA
ncbi:hypothetical protein DENSPDRAFT_842759 [Dentipellis sp. KUC8613]|nr:hypothetical protein DENSPDRAFT_842759 [Dentipellis sp. KUC8613]